MKILITTATYGNDICYVKDVFKSTQHKCDFIKFNSENFPFNQVADSRLKSKYPKMRPFDYYPGYDWYFWFDSKFVFKKNFDFDSFLKNIDLANNHLVLCKHPHRSSIFEEVAFMNNEINKKNQYLVKRYDMKCINKQARQYMSDKKFIDDRLFAMGFFGFHRSAYKLMTEWFNHNERFSLQDQISFPYVLSKYNLMYKVLDINILKNNFFEHISSLKRNPFSFFKFLVLRIFN